MSTPLSVLFKKPPGKRNAINSLVLDATVSETHEYSADVTTHPIETGGFVSDHVFENPRRVSVEGEVTSSPVQLLSSLGGLSDRRIEAYDRLVATFKAREVVTLVTGLKVYSDMVMSNLTMPRDVQTGQRLIFTADFIEVRKVASRVVGVAPEKAAPAVKDKVSKQKTLGRREPVKPTAPVEAKAEAKAEQVTPEKQVAPKKPSSILFELLR